MSNELLSEHVMEMTSLAGPNGRLETFANSASRDAPRVVVLPNGYGMLQYAHSVCGSLSRLGVNVHAINCSGQGLSDGQLSLASLAADIEFFLSNLRDNSNSERLTILAHCTAMLPLLELNRSGFSWSGIETIILYGYLADPAVHFARFIRKARRYHVRVAHDVSDLPDFTPADYAALPCGFVVVHPRIPNNLYRASVEDVLQLATTASPRGFYLPDFGYAISDHPQSRKVDMIIDSFIAPYLGTAIAARMLHSSLSEA